MHESIHAGAINKNAPEWGVSLLRFFVHLALLAVLAVLHELKTILQDLFVLARVIVNLLAHCAFKFDEVVLGHIIEGVEPAAGLEPATYGLQNRCSTAELRRPRVCEVGQFYGEMPKTSSRALFLEKTPICAYHPPHIPDSFGDRLTVGQRPLKP
jgi:hypothetical protein